MQRTSRPLPAALLLALFAPLAVGAQQAPAAGPPAGLGPAAAAESVFAPFPSRLRAAMTDAGIVITWLDSPHIRGGYAVYRGTSFPGPASIPAAERLGQVAPGIQTWTDTRPGGAEYYYFVLALAEDGSPYPVIIPARNATTAPLAIATGEGGAIEPAKPAAAIPAPAAAAPPARAPTPPPGPAVLSIVAEIRGDAVVLGFTVATKGSRLVLYRGASRIERTNDLLDATLVTTFVDKNGSFVDYPVPGTENWYALLGEEDLKAGRIEFTPGKNATKTPVKIAAAAPPPGFTGLPPSSRTPPLPAFLLDRSGGAGSSSLGRSEGPPPLLPLSSETEKALASLLAVAPPLRPAMPELSFLPEELSAPAGGEDYALSLIANGTLAKGDWKGAADQLRKYLSLNRSAQADARARFYLGQALAKSGAWREAFFELLTARERYTVETKSWLDWILFSLRSEIPDRG